MFGEQVAVQRIVGIAEEGLLAAVAALGHVMWVTGKDGAGESGHGTSLPPRPRNVNLVHWHRNP